MATIRYLTADAQDVMIVADATVTENHAHTAVATKHAVDKGANISDHVRKDNPVITLELWFSDTPIRSTGDNFYEGAVPRLESVLLDFSRQATRRAPGGPKMLSPGSPPKSIFGAGAAAVPLVNVLPQTGGVHVGSAFALAANIKVSGTPPTFEARPEETVQPGEQRASLLTWSKPFNRPYVVFAELLRLQETGTLVSIETDIRVYDNMVITGINPTRDAATGNVLKCTLDAEQIRIVSSDTVQITKPLQTRGEARKNKGTKATSEPNAVQEEKASALSNILGVGKVVN